MVTTRPFFSIVIPAYNRRDSLIAALDSIAEQTFDCFEVIVIDDGSSDDSAAVAESHPIKPLVIRIDNSGPAHARNVGIKKALGTYVAFLDSDDLWFTWTLSTYHHALNTTESPAFLAGRPFKFKADSSLASVSYSELIVNRFKDYLSSSDEWRWFGVSSFVIRRDILLSVDGFVSKRMNNEDADLGLRLGTANGFIQILSPYTFAYRIHAGNITNNLSQSIAGCKHILNAELKHCFPGGSSRSRERRRVITRHIRPLLISCIKGGHFRYAIYFYMHTLRWHIIERRLKFIVGLPIIGLYHLSKRGWILLNIQRNDVNQN